MAFKASLLRASPLTTKKRVLFHSVYLDWAFIESGSLSRGLMNFSIRPIPVFDIRGVNERGERWGLAGEEGTRVGEGNGCSNIRSLRSRKFSSRGKKGTK